MRRYLAHVAYVLKHKYYVFVECMKLGVPIWIALVHDWDKFLPDELIPYSRYSYAPDGAKLKRETFTNTDDPAFNQAVLLHYRRNKHHWEHWCSGSPVASRIPDVYVREMVADWRGAGRGQGRPDTKAWYLANCHKMNLHRETRILVEKLLGVR
jgi:hypothetical protein